MIKITSQNPVRKHIFTTLLHGVRYDVDAMCNTLYKCGCNDNGSFSRKIENAFMIKKFVDAVNDHIFKNCLEITSRKFVEIETVGNCTDLRIKGSNLDTGKRAIFHVNGKNQGYKIYMTNNGNCLHCYIKQKGKNKTLQNDQMIGRMSPFKLQNLVNWYFEI